MKYEPTASGSERMTPESRPGEAAVKWPVLAQLPWVSEASAPSASPLHDAIDAAAEERTSGFSAQYVVEPLTSAPYGERRVDAPSTPQAVAKSPHLNLDRYREQQSGYAAAEPEVSEVHAAPPAPRQRRRIDPGQPRYADHLSLHMPAESLAAKMYRWHAARTPQAGLAALLALILFAGGLYWFTGAQSPSTATTTPGDASIGDAATDEAATAWSTKPNESLPAEQSKSLSLDYNGDVPQAPPTLTLDELFLSPLAKDIQQDRTVQQDGAAKVAAAAPAISKTMIASATPATADGSTAASAAADEASQRRQEKEQAIPASAAESSIAPAPLEPAASLKPSYPSTPFPPLDFSLYPQSASVSAVSIAEILAAPVDQPPASR